jgi:hypothetical protein
MFEPRLDDIPLSQLPTPLLEEVAAGWVRLVEGDVELVPTVRAIAASLLVERRFSGPGALR